MKQTAFWREKNGEYRACLKYSVPTFVEYIYIYIYIMQCLEVIGAVRLIYRSLGVKGLSGLHDTMYQYWVSFDGILIQACTFIWKSCACLCYVISSFLRDIPVLLWFNRSVIVFIGDPSKLMGWSMDTLGLISRYGGWEFFFPTTICNFRRKKHQL